MSKRPRGKDVTTKVIRTQVSGGDQREHAQPIYLTSSFLFDSAEHARALFAGDKEGNIYSRYGNPSVDEFVERMCVLEGTPDGVAVASGMSAIFTPLGALLNSGDHVLAARSVFGSTHQIMTRILPRWGIDHSYFDIGRPESIGDHVRPSTRICIIESPSNPALDVIDIEWLSAFCREREIILLVDNVFATPIIQAPYSLGADLVMHSATKYIDGHGRGIGGIVLGRKPLIEEIRLFARHTGPAMSPFNAWMFSRSLETLSVRVEAHSERALALAEHLESHPEVELVRYPHLPSHPQYDLARRQMCMGGGIVTLVVRGGAERGSRFLDSLELVSHSANLGDTRSIATHPASTTHSSLTDEEREAVGILPGMIRISVGLEAVADVIEDIDQALTASA
ncbi:MAG: PLP-dependent transferase [Rhodothermia bacterium]|nr:PLP-dependent transferase [Rhodothermia bacterium]